MRIVYIVTALATLGSGLATGVSAQNLKTLEVKPKTGPLANQTVYTNSHAILIGVGQYANLPQDRRLKFASKDAQDLRDLLVRSYGFPTGNIKMLLDQEATRANIEQALANLADGSKVKPGDRVLVYFSGHGQTIQLPGKGEMGFLIPYDAKVDLSNTSNRSGYLSTCLPMDGIWNSLSACDARHRLLIADACFGGLLVKSKSLGGEKVSAGLINTLLARPALQGLTAGGNEPVFEDPKLGHSVFTYKLLEELKAQAAVAGNVFLASELGASLKVSVGNLSGGTQNPQFGNHGGTEGDFVFVTGGSSGESKNSSSGARIIEGGTVERLSTKATLVVTSEPAGASILLNGKDTGQKSPATLEVPVDDQPEKLTASLKLKGYEEASFRLTLERGKKTTLEAGKLQVSEKTVTLTLSDPAVRYSTLLDMVPNLIAQAKQALAVGGPDAFAINASDLASVQARTGDLDGALKTVNTVKIAEFRIPTFLSVADTLAEAGDSAGAKAMQREAKQLVEIIKLDWMKSINLAWVGSSQAKTGDAIEGKATLQEAKEIANSVMDVNARDQALSQVARAQVKAGDFAGAKQTMEAIKSVSLAGSVLSALAGARANTGDLAGARQTADAITNLYYRAEALSSVAVAQAKAGKAAEAKITLGEARQAADAVTLTTEESSSFLTKNSALINVANAFAATGDADGSKQTVEAIAEPRIKAAALHAIAVSLAEADYISPAKQTALTILAPDLKAEALYQVAGAQARTGNVDAAIQTARAITSPFYKACALSAAGIAQAKANMISEAQTTVEEAIQIIQNMPKEATGSAEFFAGLASKIYELTHPTKGKK